MATPVLKMVGPIVETKEATWVPGTRCGRAIGTCLDVAELADLAQ